NFFCVFASLARFLETMLRVWSAKRAAPPLMVEGFIMRAQATSRDRKNIMHDCATYVRSPGTAEGVQSQRHRGERIGRCSAFWKRGSIVLSARRARSYSARA